jgi:hypothetical protein
MDGELEQVSILLSRPLVERLRAEARRTGHGEPERPPAPEGGRKENRAASMALVLDANPGPFDILALTRRCARDSAGRGWSRPLPVPCARRCGSDRLNERKECAVNQAFPPLGHRSAYPFCRQIEALAPSRRSADRAGRTRRDARHIDVAQRRENCRIVESVPAAPAGCDLLFLTMARYSCKPLLKLHRVDGVVNMRQPDRKWALFCRSSEGGILRNQRLFKEPAAVTADIMASQQKGWKWRKSASAF